MTHEDRNDALYRRTFRRDFDPCALSRAEVEVVIALTASDRRIAAYREAAAALTAEDWERIESRIDDNASAPWNYEAGQDLTP